MANGLVTRKDNVLEAHRNVVTSASGRSKPLGSRLGTTSRFTSRYDGKSKWGTFMIGEITGHGRDVMAMSVAATAAPWMNTNQCVSESQSTEQRVSRSSYITYLILNTNRARNRQRWVLRSQVCDATVQRIWQANASWIESCGYLHYIKRHT